MGAGECGCDSVLMVRVDGEGCLRMLTVNVRER